MRRDSKSLKNTMHREKSETEEVAFAGNKFTGRELQNELWDTLKGVKSGKVSYDKAMAMTALARTICMAEKLEIIIKYSNLRHRAFPVRNVQAIPYTHNSN